MTEYLISEDELFKIFEKYKKRIKVFRDRLDLLSEDPLENDSHCHSLISSIGLLWNILKILTEEEVISLDEELGNLKRIHLENISNNIVEKSELSIFYPN